MIMKPSFPIKPIVVSVVSYFTAVLFVYAATSKLLDFENFEVQLGQSPLLSAFAAYIAFAVPVIELLLAFGLAVERYRVVALKGSLLLMVIFTTYIYVILHYSAYVPCSCGGVLEKMTWNEHLVFNVVFVFLLVVALLFAPEPTIKTATPLYKKTIALRFYWITGSSFFGIASLVLLFQWSEQLIQYGNTFTRRMPPHAAQLEKQFDLKVNSYYFAGSFEGKIYLGNSTAPLLVTEIDTALNRIQTYKIVPNDTRLPFQAPAIRVFKKHFFLFEGNVPYIFSGTTTDWKAVLQVRRGSYFSYLEPIDENRMAVRFIAPRTGQSILGTIHLSDQKESQSESLLERQLDGIFDVDGSLHFDEKTQRIVYVYRYRNQYIGVTNQLQLAYRGITIDTISTVQIQLAEIKSKQINTFSAPPLLVNKRSTVHDGLLFVQSMLPGTYERAALWKTASVIDVYDLKNRTYQASFPIYNIGSHKMHGFMVNGNSVYVLIDNQIVRYRLLSHLLAKTNYKKRDVTP